MQTGDLQENHALHVYALGISGENMTDLSPNIVWMKRPKKIVFAPLRDLKGRMVEENPQ